jgi:peptide/nickel transport system ATP-binding protein
VETEPHQRDRKPLLEVRGLCKTRAQGRWWQRRYRIPALDHVDLTLYPGRTLALIGGSGAGKTTLAMCLIGLERPDAGEITFDGDSLAELRGSAKARTRRRIQLIFQDSAGALSPRMSASEIVEEPLLIAGEDQESRCRRTARALEQVGLPSSWRNRRPHELSGGQRQRLAIARALVLEPKLLILDEALAGLDLSIRGQITNLLLDLQSERDLSFLYISHDLKHAAHFADEAALMDRGRIIQQVDAAQLLQYEKTVRSPSPETANPGEHAFAAHAGGWMA